VKKLNDVKRGKVFLCTGTV